MQWVLHFLHREFPMYPSKTWIHHVHPPLFSTSYTSRYCLIYPLVNPFTYVFVDHGFMFSYSFRFLYIFFCIPLQNIFSDVFDPIGWKKFVEHPISPHSVWTHELFEKHKTRFALFPFLQATQSRSLECKHSFCTTHALITNAQTPYLWHELRQQAFSFSRCLGWSQFRFPS